MRGLDIIGATMIGADGVDMMVKSVNTAAYAANLMSNDGGIQHVGESDPAFTLQPGAKVTAAGPPTKNAKGVSYISTTVPGKDGLFWIRESSLSEIVEGSASPTVASTPFWSRLTLPAWDGGPPRWQVGLGILGGTAGVVALVWGFSGPGRSRHSYKYGH